MRLVLGVMLLTMAWPAAAQATDYGGGTAPDSFNRTKGRLTLVGIRTNDTGRAQIRVGVSARCGITRLRYPVQLNPDGTFAFAVNVQPHRLRDNQSVRQRARIAMSGQVTGTTASGTARARIVQRRGGRVIARCRSGNRPWQARVASAETMPASTQPNGAYFGLTSQRRVPFPIVLRVAPNARRVRVAVFDYRQRCRKGFWEWENITPSGPIGSDGRFRLRERFTFRWTEGPERYRVRVNGQFTPSGVHGTLTVTSVLRSHSGRVLDRCRTGRVTFAAVL
jgi:hypothetical protein